MKTLSTALKLLISLILVVWLIQAVEWREVLRLLRETAPMPLVLYIFLQLIGNLLSAAKWRFLATTQGFHFTLRDGFLAYLMGAFINNFLPSTIGGDAYRTVWLAKNGDQFNALAVVLMDRVTGLLSLILLSIIGFLFLPINSYAVAPWLIILAAILIGIGVWTVLALMMTARFYGMALFLSALFPWPGIANFVRRFAPFAVPTIFLKSLGYSLVFMLLGVGLTNWFLFGSLGATLLPQEFFGAIFLATLIANIPLSINNIGVKEWSYVLFFGFFGVSLELAVTAALLSRFLQMAISCLALPYYWRAGTGISGASASSV